MALQPEAPAPRQSAEAVLQTAISAVRLPGGIPQAESKRFLLRRQPAIPFPVRVRTTLARGVIRRIQAEPKAKTLPLASPREPRPSKIRVSPRPPA